MTAADQVVDRTYTASEVLAVTGVSYRMLDWWFRSGYLPDNASGSGTRRLFTTREVDIVYAVRALTRAGFNVQPAFDIARRLVDEDRFTVPVADIYELTIAVRTASDPVEKPEPPSEGAPA